MGMKKNNPGCGCCGDCDCPTCILFYADGCYIEWGCSQCGEAATGATFTLASTSYDYGEVEGAGFLNADYGETYTLTVTKDGCETVEYEVTPPDECPCPSGCNAGRVPGARSTATMSVTRFGSYSEVSGGSPTPDFFNCRITRSIDFSPLNHTATYEIKQQLYTDESDNDCSFDYIDQDEYHIGQLTSTVSVYNGTTTVNGSATWAAYGKIYPPTSGSGTAPDGVTPIGSYYRVRLTRTASSPANSSAICSGGGTVYALGDSSAGSLEYFSNHRLTSGPGYTSVDGLYSKDGGTTGVHPEWCYPLSGGDERYTWATFSFVSAPLFAPTSAKGVFHWEAIF